jgi:DNA-binding response OmpR family regulator
MLVDGYEPLGRDLVFHRDGYRLIGAAGEVGLTKRETLLLSVLVERDATYVSTSELAAGVGARAGTAIKDHSIEESIHTLRKKISLAGGHSACLRNRRGVGYGLFSDFHSLAPTQATD